MSFNDDFAVTLEISACQYFPYVMLAAKRAIAEGLLMPSRFIRVRQMKEQEDDGDLPAFAAAMQIIGASYVETLDTKGTDGSNVHLGGPETITGYFGGVGQPNEYALKWLDEFLYYYTNYGIQQVLNINPGTVLLGYLLHRLGVDNEFKISVYMGNDNPYAAFWTLIGAKLFSREDGTSPLIGFNWSNSINNETMEITAQFRKDLGFEDVVRYEHHIVETYKSIVRQPYNRRDELIEIAEHVADLGVGLAGWCWRCLCWGHWVVARRCGCCTGGRWLIPEAGVGSSPGVRFPGSRIRRLVRWFGPTLQEVHREPRQRAYAER